MGTAERKGKQQNEMKEIDKLHNLLHQNSSKKNNYEQ